MRLLSHWFYLLCAALWLLPAFAKAARYVNRRAISALKLPAGLALSAPEKRRLKHYLYGTTYLSVLFCALRGHTRDAQEEDRFANGRSPLGLPKVRVAKALLGKKKKKTAEEGAAAAPAKGAAKPAAKGGKK